MGPPTTFPASPAPPATEVYRYDAFISYRHTEPDRRWAKWLHSALETYRVPRKLVQQGIARRVGRVFRDEEEFSASADLHQNVESTLRESRYLIVICSPRTPVSKWVNQEISLFRQLGRDDQIFALLIEGEPTNSFPPALREIRRTITDEQGLSREKIEEVEPLAADVRPNTSEKRGHTFRMAKLRLLACLLGCRFDDLRQREQERKLRRIEFAGAFVTGLLCIMIGLTWFAFVQRKAAIANAERAKKGEAEARKNARERQIQLAEAQLAQADALGLAGQSERARSVYWQSFGNFTELGLPTYAAEIGLFGAYEASGQPIRTLRGHTGPVTGVAMCPDGRTILSCGVDHTLRVWDIITGRTVRVLVGHSAAVGCVAVSPDGHTAISGDNQGTIKVWNLATGGEIWTLTGHTDAMSAITFASDGLTALSGSNDGSLKLWDLKAGKEVRTLAGNMGRVVNVFMTRNGQMAFASYPFGIKAWDLVGGRETHTVNFARAVKIFAISPDGVMAFAANNSDGVVLLNTRNGTIERTVSVDAVSVFALDSSGRRFLTGGQVEGTVKLWDSVTGALRVTLSGHHGTVTGVAFGREDAIAVSAALDGTLRIWDLHGHREIQTLTGHVDPVISVALDRDGRTALSGSDDETLKLWDLATGKEIRTFFGHTDHVHSVVITPDGRTGVSGSLDKTDKIWDLATGKESCTLTGHQGKVWSLAITPDGREALSASFDHTLKIWDLQSGRERSTLSGPPRPSGRLQSARTAAQQSPHQIVRRVTARSINCSCGMLVAPYRYGHWKHLV
jgi:WD40 repeat protein